MHVTGTSSLVKNRPENDRKDDKNERDHTTKGENKKNIIQSQEARAPMRPYSPTDADPLPAGSHRHLTLAATPPFMSAPAHPLRQRPVQRIKTLSCILNREASRFKSRAPPHYSTK